MRTRTPNLTCTGESWRTWLALVRIVGERSGARPQPVSTAKASNANCQRVVGLTRRTGRFGTTGEALPPATLPHMELTLDP